MFEHVFTFLAVLLLLRMRQFYNAMKCRDSSFSAPPYLIPRSKQLVCDIELCVCVKIKLFQRWMDIFHPFTFYSGCISYILQRVYKPCLC